MTPTSIRHDACGGQPGTRRTFIIAAALLWIVSAAGGVQAQEPPDLAVQERRGLYTVEARFEVPQPAAVVLDVLTDYEGIPRFVPGIQTSIVRERSGRRVLVEQQAVSRFMLFTKRVHLVLEIVEEDDALRFRDSCGQSFVRYEGAWQVVEEDGRTVIAYSLRAQPSFDVPEFVLKRLFKRDAEEMVEGLRTEIAGRTRPALPDAVR